MLRIFMLHFVHLFLSRPPEAGIAGFTHNSASGKGAFFVENARLPEEAVCPCPTGKFFEKTQIMYCFFPRAVVL